MHVCVFTGSKFWIVHSEPYTKGLKGGGIRRVLVCFSCCINATLSEKRDQAMQDSSSQQPWGEYLTLSQPFASTLTPWGISNFGPTNHPLSFPFSPEKARFPLFKNAPSSLDARFFTSPLWISSGKPTAGSWTAALITHQHWLEMRVQSCLCLDPRACLVFYLPSPLCPELC